MEVFLKFRLVARHSLDEREEPHQHIWWIEVGVTGKVEQGRVVSMPLLREVFQPAVDALQGVFLNTHPPLSEAARQYPTCENLAYHFEEVFNECLRAQNLLVSLTQIHVSVDELNGEQTGSAKLTLS
jgi:6-pyruvoyl-tetrahydropterin synthase